MAYTDGDSNLAVVSVTPPHEPQVVVDSTVAAPVWLSDTDVGFVSHDRRRVFRVDVDGDEDPTVLVDLDEITDALPDEEIYLLRRAAIRPATSLP